jgi:uncharacterized protein
MADLLSLFPLPNVVLFPNVFLPLHIFEPRYREMVADALASDRMIGMVLLRPGWERWEHARRHDDPPPVYPIGCSGVITHVDRIADGRYNIVLRGIERFRIEHEDHQRSYRRAIVERLVEPPSLPRDRAAIRGYRSKLESLVAPAVEKEGPTGSAAADPRMPASMSDEDLVHALAQYLDLEPLEKQALLERECLRSRAASLVELLEMKVLMARNPGDLHVAH